MTNYNNIKNKFKQFINKYPHENLYTACLTLFRGIGCDLSPAEKMNKAAAATNMFIADRILYTHRGVPVVTLKKQDLKEFLIELVIK